MKKLLLLILIVACGVVSVLQAQPCTTPTIRWKQHEKCFIIKDSRTAVYQFVWSNGTSTHTMENPLYESGSPDLANGTSTICAAEANNNDPQYNLFGGIQDGWSITVSKRCPDGSLQLLKTVTVHY